MSHTKLGIALGGGGARGSAHIGALRELYLLGLKPDLITGTSVGALIGALLCAGMSLDQVEKEMRQLKPSTIYSLPDNEPSIGALANVEKRLVRVFTEHYGDRVPNGRPTFADLDLPLAVVATDLVTQREVVLDSGDLIKAVCASLAIPVIFPPVQIGEWQLVDGGMMNNLPFDVARSRGATHTIAIDLGNSAPYGTPPEHPGPQSRDTFDTPLARVLDGVFDRALYQAMRNPIWEVVTAVFDITTNHNVQLRLALSPPDLLIRPDIGTIGLMDFHTIDAGIAAGQRAVRRQANALEKLLTNLKAAESE